MRVGLSHEGTNVLIRTDAASRQTAGRTLAVNLPQHTLGRPQDYLTTKTGLARSERARFLVAATGFEPVTKGL